MCRACAAGQKPLAAVWWRVSTDPQKDISPDTQKNEALALAEAEGFEVPEDFIIGTDWHSLSVWDSPAMKQLRGLIAEQAIHAVFLYHPDRAPDKPAHRLLFRAICEESKVRVRCCHGQIPDGDMGEVMEFLDAWAKEKQVHRTQQGVRDGLRDRVKVKGLPSNNKPPYGYNFRFIEVEKKQIPVALEPTLTYPVLKLIWEGFLQGKAIRAICHGLVIDNIPSPSGGTAWYPGTVHSILTNPVYGGRFYALRSFNKEPKTRLKETYGKSSRGQLPYSEGHWLEDFPVVTPVVTWQQF